MAKKKCPEFENHERWLVSYADMLTLLFAVFVVLYALNLSDEQASPSEELAGSMQESFATPLEDIPFDRRIGPTESGFGIFEHFRGNQVRPPISIKYPGLEKKIKIIDSEKAQTEAKIQERLYGPKKYLGSKKSGEARIVDVQRTGRGFKLKLLARHFYQSGAIKVQKAALADLDIVVDTLKQLGRDVTVEGHTDAVPPKGRQTNWELSALRASYVLQYMIHKHNFPATKLSAAGYADLRPIAHNGTAQGRTMNRRIEMHVNYDPEYSSDQ